MAFPDDYRRVQQAGGTQAQVESTAGLPRQILVDMTNLSPRLMDGILQGGYPFAMHHEIPDLLQGAAGLEGEVEYVKDQATNDPDNPKRFWRSSKLRQLFQMLADMTDINAWIVKDSAMPAGFRASAILVADLDAAVVNGFYRFVPAGTVNAPAGLAGADQYMMMVIRQSSSELTQIVYSRATDAKIWVRSRVGGVFQAWTLATGVTAADLLLKVDKAGDTMTGRLKLPVSTNVLAQLNLRDGVAVSAPEDGDIFRVDANGGIQFRKGGITTKLLDNTATIRKSVAIIADQKAQGTASQILASGAWNQRDLNTEFSDPDGIVTISGNTFTLAAGTDCLATCLSGLYSNNGSLSYLRLYNITDGVIVSATTRPMLINSNTSQVQAAGLPLIALLPGGKQYRVEHYTNATSTGVASAQNNAGMTEIYLTILLERIQHVIA